LQEKERSDRFFESIK